MGAAPQTVPASRTATAAEVMAGWVVLAIGVVRLALRQLDVRQIELAADLKDSASGDGWEVGWLLRKQGRSWPVYCFDERLALARAAAADQHLCVFFGTEDETRGILCQRVWSLAADADLRVEPIAGCMRGPRSPATALAQHDGGVALVTNAAALAAYLRDLMEPAHAAHR